MEDYQLYKNIIINTLFGLSQGGDIQIKFYESFIPVSDELILTMETSYFLARNLKNSKMLNDEVFEELKLLYNLLLEIVEDDYLMSDTALLKDEFWIKIRDRARNLLGYFEEVTIKKFDPNLG